MKIPSGKQILCNSIFNPIKSQYFFDYFIFRVQCGEIIPPKFQIS